MKNKFMKTRSSLTFFLGFLFLIALTTSSEAVFDPSQSQSTAPQYAPGDIIIKYKLKGETVARGSRIESEHGRVTNTIAQAYKLSFKTQAGNMKYQPIHESLIRKMKDENKTEKELTGATFQKRAQKDPALAKKMSQRSLMVKDYGLTRKLLIKLSDPNQDVKQVIERLKDSTPLKNTDIESIEAHPNYIYQAAFIPNDPQFPEQWGLHNTGQSGGTPDADIDAPEAWDITQGNSSAVIAVIDTGVDYNHEDLAQNIWINDGEDLDHNGIVDPSDFNNIDDDANSYIDDIRGWDFIEEAEGCAVEEDCVGRDNNPTDVHGHGTHVSGIAAAQSDNAIGTSGVCPNCLVMAVRAGFMGIDGRGYLEEADIEKSIVYAVDNGANVINMSFGSAFIPAFVDELQTADEAGLILIAAAGNGDTDQVSYPAALNGVIAVAATDSHNLKASFSNYGGWVDLSAPGKDIVSAFPDNQYRTWSGTSMAAPHTAGLAALIKSLAPGLDSVTISELLILNTSFLPPSNYLLGTGLLNAYDAVVVANGAPDAVIVDDDVSYENLYLMPGQEWNLFVRMLLFNFQAPFSCSISTTHPDMEIISSQVLFSGEEDPDYANNDNAPFRFLYQGSLPFIGEATVTIHVTGQNIDLPLTVPFEIKHLAGWPKSTGDFIYSSPAAGDLDGDGIFEVVIGSYDKKVYAWNSSGNLLSGWPRSTASLIFASPVLTDFDSDGAGEVVVGSYDNKVHAWNLDGTYSPGWPVDTGIFISSSPAAADLDGDGEVEIVSVSYDGNIYVWHSDESLMENWPQFTGYLAKSSPAIADLDGDETLEIVTCSQYGHIYVWRADGTVLDGWPVLINQDIQSSPAVCDLDYEGGSEIIVGANDGNVYVWHNNGILANGWPQATGDRVVSSPAISDLDGDGEFEIVTGSHNGKVYAWHADGSIVNGWPQTTGGAVTSSPALADLDGNGTVEVLVGSEDYKVYAWQHNGELFSGWPLSTGNLVLSSPSVSDLDRNGTLEVVIGSGDHKVYAWTLPYQTNDRTPWPMFRHDPQHTGLYIPNHSPTFINPPSQFNRREGEMLNFDLPATDSDGDNVIVSVHPNSLPLPSGAVFISRPETDLFRFFWNVPQDQTDHGEVYLFTFIADDGRGGITEHTVTVNIEFVNQPPLFSHTKPSPVTGCVGRALSFRIFFSDPDQDSFTVIMTASPQGSSFNPSTNVFTWTPAQAGTYFPQFTARDEYGAEQAIPVPIRITVTATCPSGGGPTPQPIPGPVEVV